MDLKECLLALELAGVPPAEKLARYMQLVLEINQTVNITGAKNAQEFALKHIADVWRAVHALGRPSTQLYDVGSGGGLPGIPLAIILPETQVTLVERRLKKMKALDHMVSKLGLESRVRVKGETLEAIPNLPKDAEYWFRGFLPGPKLARYFSEFFPHADFGSILLMKGPAWGDEKLGIMNEKEVRSSWRERFADAQEVDYELPHDAGKRTLVLV